MVQEPDGLAIVGAGVDSEELKTYLATFLRWPFSPGLTRKADRRELRARVQLPQVRLPAFSAGLDRTR